MAILPASERSMGDPHPQVSERRLNMRLMSYWQDLRGEESFAPAVRFDPEAVAELWPHCFTMVPADKPEDATLDHIGAAIAAASDLPAQALPASDVPTDTLLGAVLGLMAEVMKVRYPIVDSGDLTDRRGRHCLYRCILLPLTDTSGTISLLIGGARARWLPAQE